MSVGEEGAPILSVLAAGDRVSVEADRAPLQALVSELATKAGLRLVQHAELPGTATLRIDDEPLPDALDSILGNLSYQLFQPGSMSAGDDEGPPVTGTLWVFSEGAVDAPVAAAFFETVLLRGDYFEKKEAIRDLRRLGTPAAVRSLSIALGDEDGRIRDIALEALADIGSDEALGAIAGLASDVDPWTRKEAVASLSSGDEDSAFAYLDHAMSDPDPRVRKGVIDAYADIPDERAIAALGRALNDEDPEVRQHALDALDEARSGIAFRALMEARELQSADPEQAARGAISDLSVE